MEEEVNIVKTAHPFWNQDAEPLGYHGFVKLKIRDRAFPCDVGPIEHQVAHQGGLDRRQGGHRFYRSRLAGVQGSHCQTGGERFRVQDLIEAA